MLVVVSVVLLSNMDVARLNTGSIRPAHSSVDSRMNPCLGIIVPTSGVPDSFRNASTHVSYERDASEEVGHSEVV